MDFTSKEQTPRTFLRWYSIWLTSNQFNWFPLIFFQSKRYPRNFNQWNQFMRKTYTRAFPRNSLWQKLVSWNSIQSKLFFLSFQFEIEFPPISSWWSWFLQLFHGRNQSPWFFCARSSLLWLSPEWKKVSWIFKNEINFYRVPSTSFMLHGVTNTDMFFPWISEYLKLTSLLFSMNFLPWIFSKKIKLTCFSLRWFWFRCVSLSMTPVFLRFLSLK